MLKDDVLIGVILIYRQEVRPFTNEQIALLQSFADQAAIAIENVRLFKETNEALQQQAATADVLKVISRSTFDLQAVLHTLAESAARLCDADQATITRQKKGKFYRAESFGHSGEFMDYVRDIPVVLDRGSASGRALLEGVLVHIADVQADTEYTFNEAQRLGGYRTCLGVPVLREGVPVGVLSLTRSEVRPFSDKQIELVKTFADQAAIAIENARLFDEVQAKTRDLEEALTHQTASGNILAVIASSPTEVAPALQAIVESACKLCDAYDANVLLKVGNDLQFSAHHGPIPTGQQKASINRDWVTGRAVVDRIPVQVSDFLAPEAAEFPLGQEMSRQQGHRCTLSVPLLREGEAIGAIVLRRLEPVAFNGKQIALLQTFADQAVIAIGNVRLFEEVQAKTHDLTEALTYQTGSSNILKVIASSPTDVGPVLKAIVESACGLCEAHDAVLRLKDGDNLCVSAHHGPIPTSRERWPINPNWTAGRSVLDRKPIHVSDMLSPEGDEFPEGRKPGATRGLRTILSVPLLREGEPIGAITLRRTEVSPFSKKQMSLLQTFADQAVIAIGNVRLFEEVQTKTRDLEESLQQQTATAEVLEVINSSPGELTPVFDAMLERAMRLCRAAFGGLWVFEGDSYVAAALRGVPPDYANYLSRTTVVPGPHTAPYRFREGERSAIQNVDLSAEVPYLTGDPQRRALVDLGGARSALQVPLVRDEVVLGVITVYRQEVRPFSDKQIELLQNFAAQAVIAIENARLFNETKEALERQTATADILKVIARSPSDVQPVFEAIATSANRLIRGFSSTVFHFIDGVAYLKAFTPTTPAADEILKSTFPRPVADFPPFEMAQAGEVTQVPDTEALSDELLSISRARGFRSMLFTPLMDNGISIGFIAVTRVNPGTFAGHHVELLRTFADQAAIAIENTRLFEQVQARTQELTEALEQQTATSEVLSVISSSAGDLAPVFEAMLGKAMQLCGTNFGVLNTFDGTLFHTAATYGLPPAYEAFRRRQPLNYAPTTAPARLLRGEPYVEIDDLLDSETYRSGDPNRRALVDIGGARSLLAVPLVKDESVVGTVMIFRQEKRPFSEKQITLLQQFAAQAVIAIENTRLLRELRERTHDLSQSLEELRAAQNRLVQTEKLASLGQLTAGIAHEIKNPLNFINNFSALSAELVGELDETLAPATLDQRMRGDVGELTQMLKLNLEKVVHHGKRADSIVKNMLLHSREGSGEHRSADINAIVEESLNLAYHGARAERPGFNITLKRELDPEAGSIELYPQEITRALLNLISNGFYAATKRSEAGTDGFEPMLSATTKSAGNNVEIRIRDNGTGIPSGIKEKIFNPFFTTKPAGEGTGLGLSMSHDIIVKQHGGTIEVETEPGQFTEFTITLPRRALAHTAAGGRSN
jgi:GAF domain-containing protein